MMVTEVIVAIVSEAFGQIMTSSGDRGALVGCLVVLFLGRSLRAGVERGIHGLRGLSLAAGQV
jgi:hypothetical protein